MSIENCTFSGHFFNIQAAGSAALSARRGQISEAGRTDKIL
jgi:hypothetical protein